MGAAAEGAEGAARAVGWAEKTDRDGSVEKIHRELAQRPPAAEAVPGSKMAAPRTAPEGMSGP